MALNPQRGIALPDPVIPPKSSGGQERSDPVVEVPSPAALRRVLRRARDGVALNVEEAALAMTARGNDLVDLCASAARVRDAGLEAAGRRGPTGKLPVSYSRKVFIPVTHLCRDTCHYCTFVTVPGKLRAEGMGMFMEPDQILDVARRGAELGCKEALLPWVTARRRAGPKPGSGSTSGVMTRRWTTCARWPSGCSRRRGCCRI